MKYFLIALFTLISLNVSAKDVAGSEVNDSITVAEQTLILNGVGIREKWVFDVYSAALYLTKVNHQANYIIDANETMVIELKMLRDVDGKSMAEAIHQGFTSALNNDLTSLENKINTFLQVFGNEAVKGNVYTLAYSPEIGTQININGKLVSTIEGLDFKQALYAIWLGKDPAQDSLKNNLLGL
ncbi:chalcone isomerase family protein [Thalassotalea aquiviva]|uniref:chalcone isomerase family protein n=1 Tax=Thalassotalea aquiviva TaxID=3242415 RepID=UPI00352A291A